MEKFNILMVEDEIEFAELISEMMEDHGYAVDFVSTGEKAFEKLSKGSYHLIMLDINLPDTEGFAICKEIRKLSSIPIIFATARTSESDRITGFDIGGDDFIPKPYSMKELLSRVNAVIRRTYGFDKQEEKVNFGNICVDTGARTVTKDGIPVSLSLREFDLLACLLKHKDTAVSKETLLSEVWGIFNEAEPATLTVHIRWLREKLEDDPQNPRYIKTIYKVGYMLAITDK